MIGSWIDNRWVKALVPLVIGAAVLGAWEWQVSSREVPEYVLPAPSAIAHTLWEDSQVLLSAWLVTFRTMMLALSLAVVGGVLLSLLFVGSRLLEVSLFPYAVVLQVTPLIVIAPLLTIWIEQVNLVLLLCAWIVAFFPILSNTVVGLKSADRNLLDLMRLYRASPWQRLRLLLIPSALPYFLAGLKVAANLSLVGAVVAEFAVGAGGAQTGLASVILESSFQLQTARLFAALAMISATGIAIYFAIHLLTQWLLGAWHESALGREA